MNSQERGYELAETENLGTGDVAANQTERDRKERKKRKKDRWLVE